MRPTASSRIRGADGLRAFASLAVVFHHLIQRLNPEFQSEPFSAIHFIGMRGEVGVSIFFVLSGALLSYPFWLAHLKGTTRPSLRVYIASRAARIAPATWLNILVVSIVATTIYGLPFDLQRVSAGMLFASSFHYSTFFPTELNGPLWSISFEVCCYMLLPIVLLSIMKKRRGFRNCVSLLLLWIFLLQILNPLLIKVFMTSEFEKGWQFGLVGGAKAWIPYWNIDTFFTQFLLGSLVALFLADRKSRLASSSIKFDIGALISLTAAIVLVLTRVTPGAPDSFTNQPYAAPWFSMLIAIFLGCSALSMYVWRFLDNRFAVFLATISFGVYLWHYFVISIFANSYFKDFQYFGVGSILRWAFISSLVITFAISIATLSWYFFEKPIIKQVKLIRNKQKAAND